MKINVSSRLTLKNFLAPLFAICLAVGAQGQSKKKPEPYSAYLFVYFTGNDIKEESIRFALSSDGYHYQALNGNKPILSSAAISETGGVRDPHITRSADGKTFYMVATDMVSAKGWSSNRAMVLLKSTDLINWTSSVVNIQKKYADQEDLRRVWAPQTIYDPKAGKYMIYFSLQYGSQPDKIFYAYANPDFTDLEGMPKQLFYSPDGAACIDGDIVARDGKYYLFFKTEDRLPGIKVAVSDSLTNSYQLQSPDYVQQTKSPVEGAGTFKLNDGSGYILMYDMYTSGRYQFTKTTDLKNFKIVDADVTMNFHPRHGTVVPITLTEAKRLADKWLSAKDILETVSGAGIRKNSAVLDTANKTLQVFVEPGTDLHVLNLIFNNFAGVTVMPSAPQNFAKGPVKYKINIGGARFIYSVSAAQASAIKQ